MPNFISHYKSCVDTSTYFKLYVHSFELNMIFYSSGVIV